MEKRILVVDDDAPIREMMATFFTRAGYSIHTAEDAEEALALMKTYKFPVFFLDLNLPGMNGIELCRIIRKENPLSIVYAVTGYGTDFEVSECRKAGFEDYFTKPAELKVLLHAAEQAFQKLERWRRDDVPD
jgi:CheY-like chemotaxis protein